MKEKIIILTFIMAMVFTGCAKSKSDSNTSVNKDIDISVVLEEIKKVNPIDEARQIDDFSLENELMISPSDVTEYAGEVTNVQSDCALVFICKSTNTKAVKDALDKYKQSLASNNLYAEFAEKTEQADKAIVSVKGDYVIMVIAGVGQDYSAISQVIDSQF